MRVQALGNQLRTNREFAVFWLAQAVSRLGDPITLIVLAYVVYVRTGSALLTAVAVLITTMPSALFGLVGGVIADAVGYRRAMVACDVVRAALIGLLPVVIMLDSPLWVLYAVAFVSALAGAVFNPARFAIVPSVLPVARLREGNALLVSTDRTIEILGALAAGALVITVGPAAFYVDAATFAVSALLLLQLKHDDPGVPLPISQLVAGAAEGIRFIRGSAALLANTVFSILAQLSLPVANSLTPVLLVRKYAGGNAEVGAAQFAIAEASLALGALIGSLVVQPLTARIRKGRMLILGFACYGLMLVLLSLVSRIDLALLVFAGMGIANVAFYVPNVTAAQELSPANLRGRVIGARIALVNLSWLPVIALAGSLADVYPVAFLFAFAGLSTVLVALAGAFIPVVRDLN
jgi:MFS family permease